MASDHAAAVALAEGAGNGLQEIFDLVGGVERPQAGLWRAYRLGRQALGDRFKVEQLNEVVLEIFARTQDLARELVAAAARQGVETARAQLATYGMPSRSIDTATLEGQTLEALMGSIGSQLRQVVVQYAVTGDALLIIGDGTRVGALGPAPSAALLTQWLTTTHQAAFAQAVAASPRAARFRRQAVATLSKRTTLCCLAVHGQVVGLDEPFTLTGTPRFADQLMHAPFHHYCRTVEALVPADQARDQVTQQMRAGANAEIAARAQGSSTQRQRSPTALTP